MGWLADYGFRPAQVIWAIAAIVPLSWLMFRVLLQVVAFGHQSKPGLLPVGWTFVFDRLLPVYRMRDEHYDIGKFYQRGVGPYARKIRYFGRDIQCVPATPLRARLAQIYLDVLKALGIILAAFLVAAVNALIAR